MPQESDPRSPCPHDHFEKGTAGLFWFELGGGIERRSDMLHEVEWRRRALSERRPKSALQQKLAATQQEVVDAGVGRGPQRRREPTLGGK